MVEDARFEDGGDAPMALRAFDADDIRVISALAQDAVFPISEMAWDARRRRFAVLMNRFRWEDGTPRRPPERVRSVLTVEDVGKVSSRGIDRTDTAAVLSLLAMEWTAGGDGAGRIVLVLAGGGAIALEVEALEVTLKDVTRPYAAPSGRAPRHAG